MAYTTIKKPSDYFNTNLYTGNNTETSHTVGFQPDLTWLKVRNASGAHYWFDAVRGATNYIRSDNTAAEGTDAQTLKSFDTNGYTVGTANAVNTNTETMVGWNWLGANGTASNTDGSITSTVSANTTSGFSIVSYTGNATAGATVGHGLGVTPDMFIVKVRSTTNNWAVYHKSMGATKAMYLDQTSAETTDGWLNNTAPDSSVFTLSGGNYGNTSGNTHIAYCFAEKQGFSKFGSYVGNGNADGTFVYTGFKPACIILKNSSVAGEYWNIWDNKRDIDNPIEQRIYPNLSNAESTSTGGDMDFLSNGFKLRNSGGNQNGSGQTFIYMAFAEEPLVGDNPATAR